MAQFEADLKIPDFTTLAHEQYVGHKEQYVVPGKVDVKQILISNRVLDDAQAKARAGTVAHEAADHPAQFDALLEQYSDDPAKSANHGLVPDATSARNTPAFAKAAKELKKPGAVSPVIAIPGGYAVIKLIERTPDSQQTFEQARDRIVATLRSDYVAKQVKDHADQLRNEPIDASPDLVASLRTRYGQVQAIPGAATTLPAGK
ncbi:MAG: peptidylprolyl isomerase [Lysobacterales bacterium]